MSFLSIFALMFLYLLLHCNRSLYFRLNYLSFNFPLVTYEIETITKMWKVQ